MVVVSQKFRAYRKDINPDKNQQMGVEEGCRSGFLMMISTPSLY